MVTKKPRKQRKRVYRSSLHIKQKMLGAHLSKEIRAQLKIRTLPVRKGDEVKVVRGKFKGTIGKVTKVMLKDTRIFIDNVKRKKASGEEVHIPIHPSNVIITNPDMSDQRRIKARR